MSERSVLAKKLDDITSVIVRIRADWRCIKCGRRYEPIRSRFNGLPRQNMLTTSHYWNRWRHSVRWDYANLDAMCKFCHDEVEHKKHEEVDGFNYENYMFEKLGQAEYERMMRRSEEVAFFTTSHLKMMLTARRAEARRLNQNVRYF
jgi:hypothetical protein